MVLLLVFRGFVFERRSCFDSVVLKLQVHGYNNETGNFGFYVDDTGGAPVFDNCEAAGGPVPLDKEVTITLESNLLVDTAVLGCGLPSGSMSTIPGGVWLYTVGDGGSVTVSVCDELGIERVYVYTKGCSALECLPFVSPTCSVSWDSLLGETYYILVS